VSASRLPALGTAALAAACVTVTPAARSAAPINSCSTSQQCQAFAPEPAAPSCVNGICQSSSIGNWTAVVSLSHVAAYGAGATFAVPFSTLLGQMGSCQTGATTCPQGRRCTPLPALVSGNGELIVEPNGALPSEANWNLGNPAGQNTIMPVHATFRPQLQLGSSFTDATAMGLGPIDAQDVVDTSPNAPPGPGAGPSLFYSFSLAPLTFERTLMPVAPFDQAFPPDTRIVDLSMAPYPVETVIYGCDPKQDSRCAPFDVINSAIGPIYPTFDLSRSDGRPLDGWTAYLRDQTSLRRISNAVTLSGTEAKAVRLLTSHHPKTLNALENAALVMQPPSGSSLPTAILEAVNGVLDATEVYPQLPAPVTVSGTLTHLAGGGPIAADVVFESVGLCRNLVQGATKTVVLDMNPDLAFATTVSVTGGSYSAVLPMGVYRATVRPYDTTAQVTVLANFATTTVGNQQCGSAVQPGPIVLDVQRTVRGTATVADGRLLAGAAIEAIPTECSDNTTAPTCLPRAGATTTASDGSFTMALDPGTYLLRVRPAEGTALPWVVTPLTVGPGALTKANGIPPVPAPFDAGLVLLDPVACNPIVEAVVRMYETPATGSPFEIGEALTDSTGRYDMYLRPPPQ
jgi:hypothetical protein